MKIAAFRCPSESRGKDTALNTLGDNNYTSCTGDWCDRVQGTNNTENIANPRGMFSHAWNTAQKINDFGTLVDGTSNTLAMSEITINQDGQGAGITTSARAMDSAAFPFSNLGSINASTFAPNNYTAGDANLCRMWRNGKEWATGTPGSSGGSVGRRWADGLTQSNGFTTINPPNDPRCYNSADTNGRALIPAGSYHSGGVNAVLADGAVRFVTDSVDCGNLNTALMRTSGRSQFGVWGAMGSINGAESTSL